ncbi:MAG: hypothetical protein MI919_34290, partial [Holophagales bacterium]|nr:hypothetical protein [Holophagales bacterium]
MRSIGSCVVSVAFLGTILGGIATPAPSVAAEVEALAVGVTTGDPAPGSTGTFSSLELPVHQGGRIAFAGSITGGDSGGGVYRADPSGGLVPIVLEGQPSPDSNGNFGNIGDPLIIVNRGGDVAFANTMENTFGVWDAFAILVGDGIGPPTIVARGDQTPPGTAESFVSLIGPLGFNDAGQVLFAGGLSDGNLGIFLGNGGPLTPIAFGGTEIPGVGVIIPSVDSFFVPALNSTGHVAFLAQIFGEATGLILVSDGAGSFVEIARAGDETPSGNGTIATIGLNPTAFSNNPLNDRGEVAFTVPLAGTVGGTSDNQVILLGDGTSLVELVRRGDPMPDGNGSFLQLGDQIELDNAGRVLFYALATGAANGATDGWFVADRDGVEQIGEV